MKKQKKSLLFLTIILVVALVIYASLVIYNKKTEENKAKEEEESTIYVTDIDASDIISFSYEVNGETLTFSLVKDEWICAEYPDYDLDEDAVNSIASEFDHMTAVQTVEDYEDLSEYGFDEPTEILTVTTSDETTYILTVGMKNDITGDYYMTNDNNDALYLVGSSVALGFDTSIDDLVAEEDTETESDTEFDSETEIETETE